MRKTLLAPAVLAVTLATGCTIDLGGKTVERADVEAQIKTQLTPGLGAAPKSVECPGDLKGDVGAALECTLVTSTGEVRKVAVTVTSVDGSRVNFDIKAAAASSPPTPTGAPATTAPANSTSVPTVARDDLEPKIVELLTPQLGAAPKYAVCPENLRGEIGTELQCQIVDAEGLERQVLVTVSSVEGTTVDFNLKVIS